MELLNRLVRIIPCMHVYYLELIFKIYNCLQPFMVCLSYNGTIKQMRRLTKEFDADITLWSKTLKINRKVQTRLMACDLLMYLIVWCGDKQSKDIMGGCYRDY